MAWASDTSLMASGQSTIPSSEQSCWKLSPTFWESAGLQATTMPGQKPTRWSARSCWRGQACQPQREQAMTTDSRKQNHISLQSSISLRDRKREMLSFSLSIRRQHMSVSVQLGLLMIALGLLPTSLGGLIFLRRFRFLHTTYTTSGMVEKVTLMHLVDGHAYQPKITFTAQTGEMIVLTSVGMYNPPRFRVGQVVPVVYDPSNPHQARIRSVTSVW